VSRKTLDELKQQIPLLDYLQAHDWHPAKPLAGGALHGTLPTAYRSQAQLSGGPEQKPVLLLRLRRGGDLIRFAELYHQVKFSRAVALLREWCGLAPLLDQVTDFYRIQLFRHRDAVSYLSDGISECCHCRWENRPASALS
jgi:hypothetical protein